MGRIRSSLVDKRKRSGFILSLTIVALFISSILVLFSGCTTELIDTINKMVDFYNRTDKDAPTVIFTTPMHGNLTVALNTKITVTFDEYMDPETINNDPYGDGWIVRLKPGGDEGTLMTPDEYQKFLDEPDD